MADSVAETNQLLNQLCEQIDVAGPMSFAQYMELALYAPEFGYYRSGLQKFGREGDFITAPELSPLFAVCVARQCQPILSATQGDILEVGAGSGQLALGVLRALLQMHSLPNRYFILELSAELKQRQRQKIAAELPELLDRVVWLSGWPEDGFNGVVLANEVLDAMPVHQFVIQSGIQERFVTHQHKQLQWVIDSPSTPQLAKQLQQYDIAFDEGYCSEINLLLQPWMASLASCIDQGVVLLFDYGYPRHEYYHPQRHMGTLMCHHRHQAHSNPLIYPGEQDITAFVDFTLVAEAASEVGMDVLGFTHQAGFLMDCNVMSAVEFCDDAVQQFELGQQLKQLMLPGQMGEAFKVMALGKNWDESLLGFNTMNQLRRL